MACARQLSRTLFKFILDTVVIGLRFSSMPIVKSSPLKAFLLVLALSTPTLLRAATDVSTRPLTVCEIHAKQADWDNHMVLIKAHYGSGMEDSFLWDERCPDKNIELVFPKEAEETDKGAVFPSSRRTVSLSRDENFVRFDKLVSPRAENNVTCQKFDVVIKAVGRIDTKRDVPKATSDCRHSFGMCNYSARFVLKSLKDVHVVAGPPICK